MEFVMSDFDSEELEEKERGCLGVFLVCIIMLVFAGLIGVYALIRFLDNNPGFHI